MAKESKTDTAAEAQPLLLLAEYETTGSTGT